MIQLEAYKGTKSRHTCPACNSKGVFVRYTDERGEYISFDVGRCNRESKCGYHYKPKQFFADNPQAVTKDFKKAKRKDLTTYGFADKNSSQAKQPAQISQNTPDFIPFEHFKLTLGNYASNNFVKFLLDLFPDSTEEITEVLKMYFVGTFEDYTCFPSIDRFNRIARAKLIRFNPETGKRLKGEFDTSSLPAKLKLKKDFNYKQIFFGEHLLSKYPNKPIAIVEAEKTAIIASLCFPEIVWLGCNSKNWLKAERLERLGRDREVYLFPDADGFELWQKIALEAHFKSLSVKVSTLIENRACSQQKANGYDLADYLIMQQKEINQFNNFVDFYNAKLEKVLIDESLKRDFETILEEQKAILMINENLSSAEAEQVIAKPENIRRVVLSL